MIKYNLICKCGKTFESWFLSSDSYDTLWEKKLINCIYCNSTSVKNQSWHRIYLAKQIRFRKIQN